MLTPQQLTTISDDLITLYAHLEESIARDIARRISKMSAVTETASFQQKMLGELGLLYKDIQKSMASIDNMSDSTIKELFINAAEASLGFDRRIYTKAGLNPSAKLSAAAMQTLEAGYIKTSGNLKNLTMTTASSAQQTFINACTLAEMQVTSGAFDYNTAIRNAIKQSSKDGIFVTYPSGNRSRLDVAVRRNVMTGIGQTTGKISLLNARELGCDLMEISAHSGARPTHAVWQGKLVSLSGRTGYLSLKNIGYETAEGFKGINCRHDWYPFIEGISERAYSDKELEKLNEKNIEWNGNLYSEYEAEQYMRRYERAIRETRRELASLDEALKHVNVDVKSGLESDFLSTSIKLKKQEARLSDFASTTGLFKDSNRIQVLGFNKSVSQKAVWANKKGQQLKDTLNRAIMTPISKKTIASVPLPTSDAFTLLESKIIQRKSKNLLRYLKNEPLGTEGIVILSSNLKQELYRARGEIGRVANKVFDVDNIAIHNHPSGLTFSHQDIKLFLLNGSLTSIGVVGNNGSLYLLSKTDNITYTSIGKELSDIGKKSTITDYKKAMDSFLSRAAEFGLKYWS